MITDYELLKYVMFKTCMLYDKIFLDCTALLMITVKSRYHIFEDFHSANLKQTLKKKNCLLKVFEFGIELSADNFNGNEKNIFI